MVAALLIGLSAQRTLRDEGSEIEVFTHEDP
jgi:hypothetical protein